MSKLTEIIKKINPSKFHLALIIGVIAVGILCVVIYRQYHKIELNQTQIEALTDTVTVYKTKAGKNGAYRKILTGTKDELLTALKTVDPTSYNLIKRTPSIHYLTTSTTETRIDTVTKVDTIRVLDANNKPVSHDSLYITKSIKNKYYDADIKLVNDSISLGLLVRNKSTISAIDTNLNKGFFKFLKPKSYIVKVENDNPYTYNTGLTTYEIKQKSKAVPAILIIAGATAAALLLHK